MKYSLTNGGILVMVVGQLLMKFGFSEVCSNELITNAPLLVGGLMAWIGRVRKGDVNFLGVRK
ncbi:MAG: hypothetical protein [Podoviridae sp. ctviO18]|nr:MAG: hypothetical protein [Podoviridae sp. ctviO18]